MCSRTCCGGFRQRTRNVTEQAANGGAECVVSSSFEVIDCDNQACPGKQEFKFIKNSLSCTSALASELCLGGLDHVGSLQPELRPWFQTEDKRDRPAGWARWRRMHGILG